MTVVTGDSKFSTAKWIVSPHISDGATHTTIASALTSATSGDTIFIRPGTYTENPTLVPGVNLCAFDCDAQDSNVTILGKCTLSSGGTVSISGINLQTNSDYLLVVSGSSDCIVNLINCAISVANNTAIDFTNSNASSEINVLYCTGNLATTAISLHAMTSPGTITYESCLIYNTGNSQGISNNSQGVVQIFTSFMTCAFSNSGSASGTQFKIENSTIDCGASGTQALSVNAVNALGAACSYLSLGGGAASALEVGANAIVNFSFLNANSGATHAIVVTGGATMYAGYIVYSGTSSGVSGSITALPVFP